MRFTNQLKLAAASLLVAVVSLATPMQALAVVSNPAPAAKVSFTFDDGLNSAYTQAAPTLAKYGLTGTDYVITGCVGMTTVPNTCHANTDTAYMSWAQIIALQNTYGWEIGSHTVSHPYLATSDATDGQPNVLTPAQVTQELTQSKAELAAQGINTTDFASPYGDYNMPVLAQIAKYYASQRGFGDQNNNVWPYSDYIVNDYHVEGKTTVAQVKAKIDQAIAGKYWLVLTFHDIKATGASTNPDDYEYSTSKLGQIAAYVKTKQTAGTLQSVHVNQGLVTSDSNLLANGSFNDGIADGWTTDSPTGITKDTATNGSYPDPTNSLKFVASSANEHLYSPKVTVDPNTTYGLKNFLNVQSLTSGGVEFYIDEYDANGNWISGQFKAAEKSAFVESLNFSYKPTSVAVAQASLQVTVTANSGITAYMDNSQWFPLSSTTPVSQTNLVANGSFDSGISGGWTTDGAATITADSASNGSPANPINSVKLISDTSNKHLFSPQVVVDSTKSYSLSSYVNVKQISSGEVGFYIDEYDANGNWISGQYKSGARNVGASTYGLNYKPSSANVKKASLQVIVMGNSGILAYIDDVKWYQN